MNRSSVAPGNRRTRRLPTDLIGALALAFLVALAGWLALSEMRRAALGRQRAAALAWWQQTETALRGSPQLPLPEPIPTAAQGEMPWRQWIERSALELQRPLCRVMEGEGRVLASAHWPASVGLPLGAPRPGELAILEEPLARRSRLALVTSRRLDPDGDLRLVSGVFLDDALFAPWPIARVGSQKTRPVLFVLPVTAAAPYALHAHPGAAPRGLPPWPALAWIAGSALAVFAGLLWVGRAGGRARASLWHQARRLFPEALPAGGAAEREDLAELLEALAHRRTRLAIRLQAARRLAGWRSAGRALAHEVRNALTPVRISLELATRAGAERPPDPGLIREALQALGAAEVLLEEFSDFARLPQGIPQRIVLQSWVAAVARRWVPGRPIPLAGGEGPHGVVGDPARLERALGNLLRNALEAAGDGSIELEIAEASDAVAAPMEAAESVRLTVWNAGPPIPAEVGTRIFQGGATTKAGGSGLGLAIARSIALQWGGDLRYRNTRAGVAFDLWLPLADRGTPGPKKGRGSKP